MSARATWPDFSLYRPHPSAATLLEWIAQTRAQTWAWLGDLTPANARGPRATMLNPPLWEVGHLAWFWEKWLLRAGDTVQVASSLMPQTDTLYDSAAVAHHTRWDIALLPWDAAWHYLDAVLAGVRARIESEAHSGELAYFTQLCIFHQDMHNEAFAIRRQTLGDLDREAGLKALSGARAQGIAVAKRMDIAFPAGVRVQGAAHYSGFVFDNEKWAHEVRHDAFAIASHPVTQGEYARFLDDLGAGDAAPSTGAVHVPSAWRKRDVWECRVFDTWQAIAATAPVAHVSALQAEAYCQWAGRRLPSETEWEIAQPQLQDQGSVWEWTASAFRAYPGFAVDPYADYSAPWFDGHFRVLRGGSVATTTRNIRRTWRNFYLPARSDMFCGFRTCTL